MSDSESEESSSNNGDETTAFHNTSDSLRLDPPTFSLPDSGEYEVWTIRMPREMDIAALNGIKLDVANNILGHFQSKNDESYGLVMGPSIENETFRILVPSSSDPMMLVPSQSGFDRHVTVVHQNAIQTETEVAPRVETAPSPHCLVRHAYSHVPQKKGMKRRWNMPGCGGSSTLTDDTIPTTLKQERNGKTHSKERERMTQDEHTPGSSAVAMDSSPVSTPKSNGKSAKKEKKSKSEKKSSKKEKKQKRKSSQ